MFSKLTLAQKWAVFAGFLLLSYAVAGFLVAPPIVRSQAESALREQLGRDVRIEGISINPFALSASVHGFALPDADGSEFLAFEELYVDFQLSSLFRRTFTFDDVALTAPDVHIKVLSDGTLNFADLLEQDPADEPEPQTDPEEAGPPPLLVFLAKISEGRLRFSDLSLPTPFEHEISPLDVEVRDFGTRPDDEAPLAFTATTSAGEKLEVEGRLSILPLHASGRFALSDIRPRTGWLYLQDSVTFEIVDGTIALEGEYDVDAQDGVSATLDAGAVRVRDFEIVERATGEPVLTLPAFDVEGISVAYPEQRVRIALASSSGLWLRGKRLEDGRLRSEILSQTTGGEAETEGEAEVAAPSAPHEAATGEAPASSEDATPDEPQGSPWQIAVDEISLEDYRFEFVDLSTPEPAMLQINPIALSVHGLSTEADSTGRVELSLTFEEEGAVEIEGAFALTPPKADLDVRVSEIDLSKFEPYVQEAAAVGLESGRFGLTGRVTARPESEDEPLLRYEGSAQVVDLRTRDLALDEELAAWSALSLEGLAVAVEPTSLHLRKLLLREPSANVVIRRDGLMNLAALPREEAEPEPAAETAAPAAEDANAAAEPIPVAIDLIEIVDASASFSDRSVEPRFDTAIARLNGRIEGFSTEPASRTKLDLEGRINEVGVLRIEGAGRPFAATPSGDLKLDLHNLQLLPMTSYSGRYVGQAIERGSLFLDLDYEIRQNALVAGNKIRVDEFTFGESVESADAVDLPVGLAVGLLKDAQGQINIDLPLTGSLDDPEFSVLALVAAALRDLVTKAATAPFTLVAGLVGGEGEELRFVAFASGSAELDAIQRAKLETLSSVLQERPNLALGIAGAAASETDGPGLQASALEAQLRMRRFEELSGSWFGEKPESVANVTLEDDDYERLLSDAYEARFGDSPTGEELPAVSAGSDAEQASARRDGMERRLRQAIPVDDAALGELGRKRAAAIRDWLASEGGVAAERVSLLEIDTNAVGVDQVVRTPLSLSSL